MGGLFDIPITQIHALFSINQIPQAEQAELLEEIQHIQSGALQVLNSKDE